MKKLALLSAALLTVASAQAAIIPFDLFGSSVNGLLHFLNEPSVASGGTGGEIGAGIFYDDTDVGANVGTLTINVGWGSGNGFTDLSSNVTNQHLHISANNFGFDGVGNFRQTGGVAIGLTRTSNSPSNGQIVNSVQLNATQEAELFNGRYYLNVHTANNSGGEVRAFLIPVPEPTTGALAAAGLAGLLGRRRKA